ncbi:MAG: ABC transporter permease [Alphaproteobacteria bacterium]|nr:ABC transporter permease [Alphaproteobacteria bacterium]
MTAAESSPGTLRAHFGLWFGLTVITAMLVAAVFAPLPYDPIKPNADAVLQAPSAAYWMGTDSIGFDVFSRVIEAARRDLPLAFGGAIISAVIGVPLGLATTLKGRASEIIMRGLDAFQAFPLLVLAIAIVTLTGNRLEMVIFAIVLIETPRMMRLIRSEGLAIRESRFIEAAEAMGARPRRILFVHLLPNVTGIILAQTSIAAANSLTVVAALSFLGIGVSPPDPSWGVMIQAGARLMTSGQWWVSLFPGVAVFLAVMSLNLIADDLDVIFERTSR